MSIASLNQTGLTSSNSSLSYRSDQFSLSGHNRSSTIGLDDFSGNFSGNFSRTKTDELLRNASFVSRLPTITAPNRTDHARNLPERPASSKTTKHSLVSSGSHSFNASWHHLQETDLSTTTSTYTEDTTEHTTEETTEDITTNPPFSAEPTDAPSTSEPLLDNPLIFTILIAALVLWNVYGFFIQIKLLFFAETKVSTNQLFDNCTLSSSYFKYMVRLSYSSLIGGYQASAATLMIDLLDRKDQFVTRFTISPALFAENSRSKNKTANGSKTIKLRLNRRNEFPEIGSLRCVGECLLLIFKIN